MLRHLGAWLLAFSATATAASAQVAPAGQTSMTVGELMAQVRERCEAGRATLGPFQMKVEVERPASGDLAPTTAVLLVLDDKALAIMSGGSLNGLVKILDDGSTLHCHPDGAMSEVAMRHTLDVLLLGFDCEKLADPLGLAADAPVVVEESEGASYYRVEPPVNALRWIDAEDLTLAEEWAGDADQSVRDVYNNWAPMGSGAWYPELMEQWTDDVVTMRVKVEYLFPTPDLSPGVFTVENFLATEPLDDLWEDAEGEYEGTLTEDEG